MTDVQEKLTPIERIERDELLKAYRDVFQSTAGKRVLFDILEQCKMYEAAFTPDTNVTNWRLGLQEAGKLLVGRLDMTDPTIYPRLLLDRAQMRKLDQAAADAAARKQETEDDDIAP